MVKQMLKKKSKRMPAKKRYKIEKKVREHNRKIRKNEKLKKKSKNKKIIVVPGNCPFKDQILMEALEVKKAIQLKKQLKKEEAKANRAALKMLEKEEKKNFPDGPKPPSGDSKREPVSNDPKQNESNNRPGKGMSFEELVKKAKERGYQFEKMEEKKAQRDPSLKAFYREFQQVVKDSDVVIEVLDARDPIGTRSHDAEETIRSTEDKKLLMVLNKCDLVPVENLQQWVSYLKKTENCAVLPFKSNTQKQKDRLGAVGSVNTKKGTDTKKSVGVAELMGLLGTLGRGAAGGITIGVIGMPNVGKSSLINSLKRSKACNVGAKAGVTRTCQLVHLDSKLKLIDSPGICFSKDKGNQSMTIETILARIPKTTLLLHYGIPDFNDSEEFLMNVAKKYGQMKKGGVPNPTAAEQKVIHDWNTGAIRFFTEPPELEKTITADSIVSTLAKPFSLEEDFKPNSTPVDEEMEEASSENEGESDENDSNEEESQMETEIIQETAHESSPPRRVTRSQARQQTPKVSFAVDARKSSTIKAKRQTKKSQADAETISTDNKEKLGLVAPRKTLMKKIKKAKKKSAKSASALSDMVETLKF